MPKFRTLRIFLTSSFLALVYMSPAWAGSLEKESPISTSILLYTESATVLKGGLAHATRYNNVIEGSLKANTGIAGLWPEGTAKISIYHISSGRPSMNLIGDAQGASNLDAPPETRVYEAWYRQGFESGKAHLKAGIVDLNQIFDVTDDAALFLNASFGITPTISLNTSASIYPLPGAGVVADAKINGFTGLAGIFQAHPQNRQNFVHNGTMRIIEIDHDGIKAGAWQQSGAVTSSDSGLYGIVDKTLYQSHNGASLAGFVQFGASRSSINQIPYYTGGGLVLTSFISSRQNDAAGIGFANAAFRGPGSAAETAIEATYSAVISKWLTLQPDLQLILHPGGQKATPRALVFLLRAQWTLF